MNMRCFVATVALLVAGPLSGCAQEPAGEPPLTGARIGGAFSLIDQNGRTVSDRDFAGRYRIVYFGYTFCPDVCPTDVQNIAAAVKLLERDEPALARRIAPIFITIDPARDTPPVLKRFVSAFHPRLVGLTGTAAQIAKVAREYGIYFARGAGTSEGYLMDHSRQIYLFDPEGHPLALLPEGPPAAIAKEVTTWAR
ncbi:electron transporter [Sphingomonas sp. Leaf231]|uniref:SCO family protein n=1 Tax=Sphingomonas sp. Leaf231 TaxID=1736301 RepID=UPI0006F3EB9C|nr:electron transporter [Sphingomonas sp. Leaf231]